MDSIPHPTSYFTEGLLFVPNRTGCKTWKWLSKPPPQYFEKENLKYFIPLSMDYPFSILFSVLNSGKFHGDWFDEVQEPFELKCVSEI